MAGGSPSLGNHRRAARWRQSLQKSIILAVESEPIESDGIPETWRLENGRTHIELYVDVDVSLIPREGSIGTGIYIYYMINICIYIIYVIYISYIYIPRFYHANQR